MTVSSSTARSPGSVPTGGLVVLAVDDEAPALDEISYLLRQDPRVDVVLTATDAATALQLLRPVVGESDRRPIPDAVLLDIAMPGWDGVELARVLAALPHPPAVAFLSAHDDRAVEAYEIGALDYLLKPVRAGRLAEAISRMCLARDAAAEHQQPPKAPHQDPTAGQGRSVAADGMIAVDLAGSTKFVQRASVCWAEAQGDYARLQMAGGDSHLIRTPLTVLEQEWEAAGFIRVHRSYLVALSRIIELRSVDGGYRVAVSGRPAAGDLPVSRRHLRTLKQRLLAGRRPGR